MSYFLSGAQRGCETGNDTYVGSADTDRTRIRLQHQREQFHQSIEQRKTTSTQRVPISMFSRSFWSLYFLGPAIFFKENALELAPRNVDIAHIHTFFLHSDRPNTFFHLVQSSRGLRITKSHTHTCHDLLCNFRVDQPVFYNTK